jgi:hypothetical protein
MGSSQDNTRPTAVGHEADNLREFAQAILDKANAHAKSVGLWGMEAAVLDTRVYD